LEISHFYFLAFLFFGIFLKNMCPGKKKPTFGLKKNPIFQNYLPFFVYCHFRHRYCLGKKTPIFIFGKFGVWEKKPPTFSVWEKKTPFSKLSGKKKTHAPWRVFFPDT